MIEVKALMKSYGTVDALKGVGFSIGKGEIVGLLGPNGAGKTTIMKILTGYLQPDSGKVEINKIDVLSDPQEVQALIGYLPETAPLYPELSVQAYLGMMGDLRKIPEEEMTTHLSEAIFAVGLADHLTRPIGELSKGFRQRVGLAQAILHKPPLLILDEPTIGLDPTQIVEIRNLIKRLAEHSTILFSTHILPEVEALCDRAIILINGEIKADARLAELSNSSNTIIVFEEDVPDVEDVLNEMGGFDTFEQFMTRTGFPGYRIIGAGEEINQKLFGVASEKNWPVRELKYDIRTLESVFNELAVTH